MPLPDEGSAETGGEKTAPWNGAFHIKRGDQYQCQFRDMILYVTNSGTEEKFAEQWCADFNKRLAEHNAEMFAEKAKELAAHVWMGLTDPEPPTSPRSSQNQTAASGVEGAHEGTTADEKAMKAIYALREEMLDYSPSGAKPSPDSREPEKLNNAHTRCTLCGGPRIPRGQQGAGTCTFIPCKDPLHDNRIERALAESSLSSPPPTIQNLSEDALPQAGGKNQG